MKNRKMFKGIALLLAAVEVVAGSFLELYVAVVVEV